MTNELPWSCKSRHLSEVQKAVFDVVIGPLIKQTERTKSPGRRQLIPRIPGLNCTVSLKPEVGIFPLN